MAATPSNKRRKVDLENRAFNDTWTVRYFSIERNGKAQCLICQATVSVFKELNIRRHFETQHRSSKYAAMDEASRQTAVARMKEQLEKQTACLFRKQTAANEQATRASFEVSLLLAKRMKPLTDGEFVKDCLIAVADAVCPNQRSTISTVSLSAHTVNRRIEEMSGDVRSLYRERSVDFEVFSIAIDESTDAKDTSQLAVFVRGVASDFSVTEEFLQLVPMRGTTTGKDIADATLDCLSAAGLDLSKLVAITTDGAPAMVGTNKGAASLIIKRCEEVGNQHHIHKVHCIIHQEALCAKAASLTEVMTVVVNVVNHIKARSINHRQFQALLDEAEAAYGDVLYFSEVQWLSRGQMLGRVWELKDQIATFLMEKNLPHAAKFQDPVWLAKLALLTDITEHLNNLNFRLQGKDSLVTDMLAAVQAFEVKLRLWENQLTRKLLQHFPRLATVKEDDVDFEAAVGVLTGLREEFTRRFISLRECADEFRVVSAPFTVPVDKLNDMIQMEMVELQCDDLLRGKFLAASGPLSFFVDHFPTSRFPEIAKLARRIIAIFGSTYCCEQLFSKMKYTKNCLRTQLSDQHLNNILILSTSSFQPDITKLCKDRQHQPSH